MAKGPNPAGSSKSSKSAPNIGRPSVRSTPKVRARPNTVKTRKRGY